MLRHISKNTITFGRYEIVNHLARGGMAEVLLARTLGIEGFERHVVIKRIGAEQARDEIHVQMFLDEARLAAALHHHNIVQVHDIGEEQGEYFFVMEYVHGEDVRRFLTEVSRRGKRVPLEHVLAIITAAAAGLHHAHEQCGPNRVPLGIVHRDVSPENILVGYDGSVKVADFGIAKATHRSLKTESGIRKGKVSYMSPEQCVGLPVDRRSDIFALGIVLYESLTARRLFKAGNDFLTMRAIVRNKIPPPSTVWPQIPLELEGIVMKALSPCPDARYATADEMRIALEDFAAKIGLRASPTALADYMKALFGERPEPWLLEDDEPEIEVSIDVDGPASEGIPAPKDAIRTLALSRDGVPAPSSAFAIVPSARIPGAPGQPAESSPPGWEDACVAGSPACVGKPRPVRRRSRWFAAAAALAIAAATGLVLTRDHGAAAAPAVIEPTMSPGPSGPPVTTPQPAVASDPNEPPVVAPAPPTNTFSNGSDSSTTLEAASSPPAKKPHQTLKRKPAKKHWDAHALFPQ